MSAAFRNFILTLVIMLAVFGYIAIKALPEIEDAVFGAEESSAPEDASQAMNESVDDERSSSEETSQPAVTEEFDSFGCIFASKNASGDVCSMVYVGISEENKTYVVCSIPVDVSLDVGGVPKKLYSLIGSNGSDYMLKKISPLIGRDVDHYVVCDADTYKTLASLAAKNGLPLTVDLSYSVRYLDPDFAGIANPSEEYFITIPAGRTTLTEQNAAQIFGSSREEGSINYTFQESMGLSVLRQLASFAGGAENVGFLDSLRASVSTNVPVSDLMKYAALFFSYNDYKVTNITYPTMQDYNNPGMRTPNWSAGINQINNAEAGK